MNSGIAKGTGDMLLDMAFNSSIAVVIFSAGNTYLGLMLILKFEAEAEVSTKKCRMCGFSSKSNIIIRQHMLSRHGLEMVKKKEQKCCICQEV